MPDLPAALTPVECPLLAKYGGADAAGLIARFNAATARVREVAADPKLGQLFNTGKLDAELEMLRRVRERLARARYVVGCIGITQAGKSSTINSIVGQEVCKQGAMSATSSQPSRIARAAAERLDIVYLNQDEFASRRQELSAAIGLPSPPPDAEFLQLLAQPEKLATKDDKGKPRARLKDDVAYLKAFLESYGRHASMVQTTAKVITGLPFEQRYEFTTHTKGQGDETLLIKEARFFVKNEQMPDELELCDLPGLGSNRTVDDVVTQSYLGRLDGVFLFASLGENPLKEEMLKTLDALADEFRDRMTGRAWVIFTKMDTLSEEVYRDAKQGNVFGTIQQFLDRVAMPQSQVCFCSNELSKKASRGTLTRGSAAEALKQTGEVPTPPSCPAGLQPAWEELLADGGIGRLRRLMLHDVAVSLAGLIRKEAADGLTRFEEDLTHRIEIERKKLLGGAELFQKAMTCYGTVLQIRVGLTSRPADFPILTQQGDQLRRKLSALFDDPNIIQVLSSLSSSELAGQFKTHARVLNQTMQTELAGDVLDQVYQVIGLRLEGLPPVPVGSGQACSEAWQRFRSEDRKRDDWRREVPGFASAELGGWFDSAGPSFTGDVYAQVMRDKIDVVVKQTVHAVRSQVRSRLGEIERDLSLLIAGSDSDPS